MRDLDTYQIKQGLLNLPINIPSLYVVDETKLE